MYSGFPLTDFPEHAHAPTIDLRNQNRGPPYKFAMGDHHNAPGHLKRHLS